MASDGRLELELATARGSAYVLEVTEQGVDVRVSLKDGVRELLGFDGDLLRLGHHRIALAAGGGASPRLTVAGTRPGSPEGRVRVALSLVPPGDPQAATHFALDLLEIDTAQRYYDVKLAPLPASVEQARRLVAGRRESGPPRDLGRAYLLLDQMLMKQFRYDEAIAALEQSLPVFRAQGDRSAEASVLNDIGMHTGARGTGARPARRSRPRSKSPVRRTIRCCVRWSRATSAISSCRAGPWPIRWRAPGSHSGGPRRPATSRASRPRGTTSAARIR
jgi:tetratricopeptide (TPR) repeat protein